MVVRWLQIIHKLRVIPFVPENFNCPTYNVLSDEKTIQDYCKHCMETTILKHAIFVVELIYSFCYMDKYFAESGHSSSTKFPVYFWNILTTCNIHTLNALRYSEFFLSSHWKCWWVFQKLCKNWSTNWWPILFLINYLLGLWPVAAKLVSHFLL